jgi:mono/diheme cytochrome c family protein
MIGTWAADGIQCEECHGPGEFHVQEPQSVNMIIDRSNEQCGKCHIRGDIGKIPVSGGFIRHHEQWNEMFTSKHASLDCIDCHDPHKGLHEDNPNRAAAIRSSCESCHFDEAGAYEDSGLPHSELGIACIECHMAKAAKSARAVGDFKGDVRSHLFGINTDPDVSMFSEDGGNALGYLTLDFVCLQCHITKNKEWAAASALAVHPVGSTDPGGPGEETPPEYTAANGFLGGAVYSKFWTTEAGGSGTEPTVPSADFIRCKSCHAWDGLGNAASYANRAGQSTGKSTRPDVSSVNLRSTIAGSTILELFNLAEHSWGRPLNAASNDMPSYQSAMITEQKWNLVKFMKEEWVEPAELYDLTVTGPPIYWDQNSGSAVAPILEFSNIGKDGNAANGDALYAAKCAGCHGADGKAFTVGGLTGVGQFVRQKPHEAWFKVKFGEPGTGMSPGGLITTTSDLKDLYKAVTNTVAYPD